MRLVSILTALLVSATLYVLVFERTALVALATGEGIEEPAAEQEARPAERVSVVAVASRARQIDDVVLIRGRTEAARQVEVRAETSGTVVSNPLRKGAAVAEGDLLCSIDPGTRAAALAEAEARLAEARARLPEARARLSEQLAKLPEARARVGEAEARLREAEININVARELAKDGFASETRLAGAEATLRSADTGLQAAKSGQEGATAEISSAQAGVEAAQAGIRSAEAAVARAATDIERLEIRAPFAGLLESDAAELGALLQAGGLCATVIQLDPIRFVGFVPETEIDKVSVGALAGARLATGRRLAGTVTFRSRSADADTRTFRVEVTAPNADLSISDGQTAEILIRSDGVDAHLIPLSALTLNDEGELGVRVVDEGDVVGFRPVDILRDTPEGVFVAGLGPAANVIVTGHEYVTTGVAVAPTYREAAR